MPMVPQNAVPEIAPVIGLALGAPMYTVGTYPVVPELVGMLPTETKPLIAFQLGSVAPFVSAPKRNSEVLVGGSGQLPDRRRR